MMNRLVITFCLTCNNLHVNVFISTSQVHEIIITNEKIFTIINIIYFLKKVIFFISTQWFIILIILPNNTPEEEYKNMLSLNKIHIL